MVTPTDDIEEKLKELRDLQREINDQNVESADLQAQINNIVDQLNDLIPPGNVPLTYSIGIISTAAAGNAGVSGAEVTINIRDEVFTATSGSSGQVMFENLRSGMAAVHISHPDYTDVNYVVDLLVDEDATTDASNSGEDFNVTSAIGLYPTTVAEGALVHNGRIFFDPDRTDDILQVSDPDYGRIDYFDAGYTALDGPYAPAPRLTLTDGNENSTPTEFPILDARVQSWELLNSSMEVFVNVLPDPFYYSYVPAGTEGNIVLAVYEDMFVVATSNTSGAFTATLPHANRPLLHRYRLQEFVGDETYFRAENFSTTTAQTNFTSRTREVIYSGLYLEIGQDDYWYPGGINAFDPSDVNTFEVVWSSSLKGLPLNFYYGAKSRNE